jgi:hypothetical protein
LWGAGSFGGGLGGGAMRIVSAGAAAGNRLRIGFSLPPKFTRTYVPDDSARPGVFSLLPVTGSKGPNGEEVLPILVATCERPPSTETTDLTYLDVVLESPMMGSPALYELRILQAIHATTGEILATGSVLVLGVDEVQLPPSTNVERSARDFADTDILGTMDIGPDGDYLSDSGVEAFKARVVRRALVKRNGFPWAPNYGLGLGEYVKQNPRGQTITNLAVSAESQFRQDPSASQVSVTLTRDGGVLRMTVDATLKDGTTRRLKVPIVAI